MTTSRTLRLGTRPSLLALAQSRLIAAALREQHPQLEVELVTLKTRGDINTTTPLTDVRDPHFFSAELDQALIDGDIDFCVHSYKDLTADRPDRIQIAAIPRRENPADIVLFRNDIGKKLLAGDTLRIGSSSLRRQQNTRDFLLEALPRRKAQPTLDFVPLRGSVPDRLQRIMAGTEDRLDAIVVALAGVQRLWADPECRGSVADVLAHSRLMVLPLSECPTAPGQGALAIECRAHDKSTRKLLRAIHDPTTAKLLAVEERLVADAAQEHALENLALGATATPNPELGYVARLRGRSADTSATAVYQCRTALQPQKPVVARPWSAAPELSRVRTPLETQLPDSGAVFIAHWHALEYQQLDPATRCWTSGVNSWKKLARQGVWVEACTDHLGFASMRDWIACDVLQLPQLKKWCALTHIDALEGWRDSGAGTVRATYRNNPQPIDSGMPDSEQLTASTHFYWRSPQHFDNLKHLLPEHAHHACGPGKTLRALRAAGVKDVAAFPSHREWQQWLA